MSRSPTGVMLMIWMITFTVICSTVLVLRFWAAKVTKRSLRLDDYLIVFAFINIITMEVGAFWAIDNGLGAHSSELDASQLAINYKLLVIAAVTWLLATIAIKLAILWLYTCIFSIRSFKIVAWTMMGVVGAYGVAFLPVFLTNCVPVDYSWNPVPNGYCRNVTVEELTSVSVNMVIDICFVVLPMRPLWRLKMAKRAKVGITVMFCLGFFTVGIMAWRVKITSDPYYADYIFALGLVGLTSFLELWFGLIVACVPTLAPLAKHYVTPALSKLYRRSGSHSGGIQLREAQNTIGGGSNSKRARRQYGKIDEETARDLLDSKYMGNSRATAGQTTSHDGLDEEATQEPGAIEVTRDFDVQFERSA